MAPISKRSEICAPIAASLRDFGYPDVTTEMVMEIMTAWLKDQDGEMPHGIIGMMASRQFEELEEAKPGILKGLEED